jgi:predicted DNA-binding transcriptional regulator AlpA
MELAIKGFEEQIRKELNNFKNDLIPELVLQIKQSIIDEQTETLLSVSETSKLLSRSKATIYSWLKPDSKYHNTMPKPIRKGASLFFSKREILSFRENL